MEKHVKQVIVMRKDLKNRRGKEIAQGSHASMAFMTKQLRNGNSNVNLTKEARLWIENSFTKVCLKAESEKQLDDVYKAAKNAGLTVEIIIDAGKTDAGNGVGNPTKTCLAIGPNYADEIDKITGREGSNPCNLY